MTTIYLVCEPKLDGEYGYINGYDPLKAKSSLGAAKEWAVQQARADVGERAYPILYEWRPDNEGNFPTENLYAIHCRYEKARDWSSVLYYSVFSVELE